jgi:hypothetical protein
MNGKASRGFIEQLSKSRIYQDYERAFNDATGLPLTLRPSAAGKTKIPSAP